MSLPFGVTVIVHRYSRDIKGNRTEVSSHTVAGVGIAPTGGSAGWGVASDENNVRGDTVTTGEVLYGPYDMDVNARDVVEFPDGRMFEVDGAPARWRSPLSGWAPGTVVNVKLVEG